MPSSPFTGRGVLGAIIAAFAVPTLLVMGGIGFIVFASSSAQTISPDLSFRVACEGPESNLSNEKVEVFLRQRGFVVLDKVRLAIKLKQAPLLVRDLIALDSQDREVSFIQLPIGSPDLSVMLRSRPPTHRDAELEDALLTFAGEAPGCRVRQINSRENKAELRAFHDRLVAMTRVWFRKEAGI